VTSHDCDETLPSPRKLSGYATAIRSYEKRKASEKKNCKDLAVFAETPLLHRFFKQNFQAAALKH